MSQFSISKPLTDEQIRIQMEKLKSPQNFAEYHTFRKAEEDLRQAQIRFNKAQRAWDDLGRVDDANKK